MLFQNNNSFAKWKELYSLEEKKKRKKIGMLSASYGFILS